MRKFKRNLCSFMLAAAVAATGVPGGFTAPVNALADMTADYGLSDSVEGGVILHCWNWSYNNIAANMEKIASMGYSSVQTSPIQKCVKVTSATSSVYGNWYWYYQPINFFIDDSGQSALGTKAEFQAMCEKAHEYGIKVIVDVVANHMASGASCQPNALCMDVLKNDSACWHAPVNLTKYTDRKEITQYCAGALPDLNTGNATVQEYVINFLKECIDAGADGFRYDSAKHIETPNDDASYASDFWKNVISASTKYAKDTRNIDLFSYGEVLDAALTPIENYTEYINVTDNSYSNIMREYVQKQDTDMMMWTEYNYDAASNRGRYPITWAESHDTYANGNENDSNKPTRTIEDELINRTWAIVAAKSESTPLFFARPENFRSSCLGEAGETNWEDAEVAAVNKFHNYFADTAQNFSTDASKNVFVERGKSGKKTGVTIVNCSGQSGAVQQNVSIMDDGIYKDQLSGNVFTVENGVLKGEVGSTGIAVVYNADAKDGLTAGDIKVSKKSGSIVAKSSVKLSVSAKGEGIQYKFTVKSGSKTTTIQDYSTKSSVTWKPSAAGTYTVKVQIKNEFGTLTKQMKYVVKSPLSIKSFKSGNSANKSKVKKKISMSVNTSGGVGSLKYQFSYTFGGKEVKVKKYSSSKSASFTPKKTGTYKLKVYVKDGSGKVKTKTIKYKVIK